MIIYLLILMRLTCIFEHWSSPHFNSPLTKTARSFHAHFSTIFSHSISRNIIPHSNIASSIPTWIFLWDSEAGYTLHHSHLTHHHSLGHHHTPSTGQYTCCCHTETSTPGTLQLLRGSKWENVHSYSTLNWINFLKVFLQLLLLWIKFNTTERYTYPWQKKKNKW